MACYAIIIHFAFAHGVNVICMQSTKNYSELTLEHLICILSQMHQLTLRLVSEFFHNLKSLKAFFMCVAYSYQMAKTELTNVSVCHDVFWQITEC